MAVKKTDDVKEEAIALNTSGGDWDREVEVMIPMGEIGELNYEIVSVNGRVFKVKKGETVKVPAPIAEVIANSNAMKIQARQFIEGNLNKN